MAMIQLHPDFKEFLRLLSSNEVRYLLIGGHAVGFHGHPRATGDMDIWIPVDRENASRISRAVRQFGISADEATESLFLELDKVIRMGVPPIRVELQTGISGVDFEECYAQRVIAEVDGIPVNIISLPMLKKNKQASGRLKDLDDLRQLP